MVKNKKALLITLLIATIALIPILYIAKNSLWGVRDLGPKLEYIGTETTGCPILLIFIAPCAQRPGETYYFATDMTQQELGGYFEGAELNNLPGAGGGSEPDYSFLTLRFTSTKLSESFRLNYYDNKAAVIKAQKLRTTDKKYIVSLSDSSYTIAKKAVQAK